MEPISLVKQMCELMEAHDVPFHVEGEWVVPFGKLPALRATWYPRDHNGRLEVDVLIERGNLINECFVGIGTGSEGINDAIHNFCVNSLHVLLSAFCKDNDEEQVTIEEWEVGDKRYTAYIGNFGTRGSAGVSPEIPGRLFEKIEQAIKNEPVTEETNWYRCFFCDVAGEQTFEALKNNDVWDNGLRAMKSLEWKKSDGYYSVRNFLLLKVCA